MEQSNSKHVVLPVLHRAVTFAPNTLHLPTTIHANCNLPRASTVPTPLLLAHINPWRHATRSAPEPAAFWRTTMEDSPLGKTLSRSCG